MGNKAYIKGRVVGHKSRLPHKLEESRQHLVHRIRSHDHRIVDSCQAFNIKRDRHLRVHKLVHPVNDLAVSHLHGTDLDDPVLHRRKSRGLDIEHHVLAVETLVSGIDDHLLHIIDKISLNSVEDLEGVPFVEGVVRVRERLNTAVIRYRQCRHPPLFRPLHKVLHLGDTIHITHLRMAVELHALYRGVIHPLGGKILTLPDAHNRTDGQLAVKLVDGRNSLDLDEVSFLDSRSGILLLTLS